MTYRFLSDGRLSAIVDQNSNTPSYSYAAANQLSSVTDSQGHTYAFTYSNGKLTDIDGPTGSTDTRNWHYDYTGDNLTTYIDPEGKSTDYDYLSDGRLWKIHNPFAWEGIFTP